MSQTTTSSKTVILGTLESALDDNSEYIGETVWKALNKAYESMDSDVVDLIDQLDEANARIAVLEARVNELEESA